MGRRGIFLNKESNRFYFGIKKGEACRSISTTTRKQSQRESKKEVVKFYSYGQDDFYRHSAFTIDFIHTENIYLCITPTYFITLDGKTPIDGKTASKYIIPQKSREFNPVVANQIHTIFAYLSSGLQDGVSVINNDDIEIELSTYITQNLNFSIPSDDVGFSEYQKRQRKKVTANINTKNLFSDD